MTPDPRRESAAQDPVPKEAWETPRLVEHGSAEELTHGTGPMAIGDAITVSM